MATQASIARGDRRTYKLVLNSGGWWSAQELTKKLDLVDGTGVQLQLKRLYQAGHVARKGGGHRGDPYLYGVTAKCVPVPGVTLEELQA